MKEQTKRAISISISVASLILLFLCAVMPVFSFWNYRLYMFALLPVSVISFLVLLKKNTSKPSIIGGLIILLLSGIAVYISGSLMSVLICAGIGILIALVIMTQGKIRLFHNRLASIAIIGIIVVLALAVQANTVSTYYQNYDLATSGIYDIPKYVAENFLTSAFNEVGMMIVIACLLLSLIAVCLKSSCVSAIVVSAASHGMEKHGDCPNEEPLVVEQLESVDEVVLEPTAPENRINFCRKCGAKLFADSRFCSHCGTDVK